MKRAVAFFIRLPVWSNVLLFSVFGFGLISFLQMKYSFFPELQTDIIIIQVPFPGASPQEVEEGVVLKIEENLDGIEGIKRVTSTSRENIATVTVEITFGYSMEKALADVKNAIDRINSFPRGSEKPVIFEQKFRSRVVSVVLYGDAELFNLKTIAEQLRDDLLATDEISQVTLVGLPKPEISIEVSEENMRRFNLTFNEIAAAVAGTNLNISGGKFDTSDEEILIRAWGKNYYAKQLENLVVRGNADGTVIHLSDIARVKDRWEDIPNRTYYNGHNSVGLSIDKTADEDIIKVVDKARELVRDFNVRNGHVQAILLDDRTVGLRQRIDLLARNGFLGLLLVIATLGIFMNLRLSLWVSAGIPFAFAGMFIVAKLSGITINVISTFGMIIVVGILVDDAIVVAENIYAHYEKGKPAIQSAIDGTVEMLAPVFTSVMTTVIAFMPFFFLEGFLGKFIWHMALVVVASLIFSLVEAFLILPSHLAHSKGLHPHQEDRPLRQKLEALLAKMTQDVYSPVLRFTMKHKWIVVIMPVLFFMVTIGLLKGEFIHMTPFPFIDGDTLPINVSLTSGSQEAQTDSVLARIERACWQVNEQVKREREDGKDVILGIRRQIGANDFGESGSHTGQLILELLNGEERNLESFVLSSRIREHVGTIPQAMNITYGRQGFFGKPISVSLLGNDLTQLNKAKNLLMAELQRFSTLKDITDSNQEGRRELDIQLKPRAYALGLTLNDIAGQVRQGFFGQEVQRIQRGRDEVRVWVRYRPEDRAALGFLDGMRIRTPAGDEYPFSELAGYKIQRGITAINHLDKRREIKVEANLANETADLPPILAEIRERVVPRVLSQVSGVQVSFEGQSRNRAEETASMERTFPLALIGMLILLILVFRSYAQALLIFSLIPFGLIGAAWGHGIQGVQLSFLSLYGIIALSGIIVNDSIVFVDQINRNLKQGLKIADAVYHAGMGRLRPILLTTFTTVFGLAPLILETDRQAQFLIPMAISVAYGLLFGTFLILLVLPSAYLILNRCRVLWKQWVDKERVLPEAVEPAVKELQSINV